MNTQTEIFTILIEEGISEEELNVWKDTLPVLSYEDQENILLLLQEDPKISAELTKSLVSKNYALQANNLEAWGAALDEDARIPNAF